MKKFLKLSDCIAVTQAILLLTAVMSVSFVACSHGGSDDDGGDGTETQTLAERINSGSGDIDLAGAAFGEVSIHFHNAYAYAQYKE